MSNVQQQLPVEGPRPQFIWKLALLSSGLAGLIGLFLGVALVVNLLFDQSVFCRTIGGLLFMVLGVLGPVVPLILFTKRREFGRLQRTKQWAAVVAIPAVYCVALGSCWVSMQSTEPIIGRWGLTLLVRFDGNNPDRPTTVRMEPGRKLSYSLGELDSAEGVPRYRFEMEDPTGPAGATVSAEAATRVREDLTVEITLDLQTKETFPIEVEGLTDVQTTRDGKAVSEHAKFGPGKYQVVITGRPK